MTDHNDTNDDSTDPADDWNELEDEVMGDAADVWGGVDGEEFDFSLGGLGDLFGGEDEPKGIVDELLATDELDEHDVEELLVEFEGIEELLAAEIHELLDLPTIDASKAAAVVEWQDGKAKETGFPGVKPGGETEKAGSQTAGNGEDRGVISDNPATSENGRDSDRDRADVDAPDWPEDDQDRRADTSDDGAARARGTFSVGDEDDGRDGADAGETVGAALAWPVAAIASLLGGIAMGISRFIPKRTAIYRKMIRLGYRGIYKKTGAHVIANTIYGDGEMVPRKATLDREEGNLETGNGEWWTASSGLQPVYIGDTPIVYGVADHHELVDPIAARISEAVDLGPQRQQRVQRTARGFEPVTPGQQSAQAQAVADGGAAPDIPCTFDDLWIDVSNPEDRNDGMIVSLEKAYAMHWDQGSSEEMENQETRGMLAVMDPRNNRKKALIYVLLFAGGIALGMFGPGLASQIAGNAGEATGVSAVLALFGR